MDLPSPRQKIILVKYNVIKKSIYLIRLKSLLLVYLTILEIGLIIIRGFVKVI